MEPTNKRTSEFDEKKAERKPYQKPEITSLQPLEAMAAVCDPFIPPQGKTTVGVGTCTYTQS